MGNKWADSLRKLNKRRDDEHRKSNLQSMDAKNKMRPLYTEIWEFVKDYFEEDVRPEKPDGKFELRFLDDPQPRIEFVSHFRDDGIWFEYEILTVSYCDLSESFKLSINEGENQTVAGSINEAMEKIVNGKLHWI